MSDKLEPCPFCGSADIQIETCVAELSYAVCNCCGAFGPSGHDENMATAAWNLGTTTDHIVAANKTADDNPPLTLEELRGMGDELVWMEDWFTETEEKEGYGFERASDVLTFEGWRHTTNYGKMWRAYRRKPEED